MKSYSSYGEWRYGWLLNMTRSQVVLVILALALYIGSSELYVRRTDFQYCPPTSKVDVPAPCSPAQRQASGLPLVSHTEEVVLRNGHQSHLSSDSDSVANYANGIFWFGTTFILAFVVRSVRDRLASN